MNQGTGLFLSSGTTIAQAGPAGAWLAYIFMGFVTAGVSVRVLGSFIAMKIR